MATANVLGIPRTVSYFVNKIGTIISAVIMFYLMPCSYRDMLHPFTNLYQGSTLIQATKFVNCSKFITVALAV